MTEPFHPALADRRGQLAIMAVLIISLWSTIMDVVPASVTFVVLSPLVPLLLAANRTLPRVLLPLLTLYFYFIASTLFYAPSSLLSPDFYRRDGNFFVTYLPIVIGGLWKVRIDVERLIRSFLLWSTAVNALLIGIFLATGGTIVFWEQGIFHSLFIAHNAAGGYLATVSAFAIGMFLRRRKTPVTFLYVAINVLGCVLTGSRGSLIGIGMAVLVVLVLRQRYTKWVVLSAAAVQIAILTVTYPAWVSMGKPAELWNDIGYGGTEVIEAREATILDRALFLWPRATDLFLQSPVFGTGFGSYNDVPYHLVGIPHVLVYNDPRELTFSAGHAHNTYLHVLAETGIVGFVLLLIVLRRLFATMESFEAPSVVLGFKLALWTAIFASFTEHRLFTPAEMLPFTILFGITLSASRSSTSPARAAHRAAPPRLESQPPLGIPRDASDEGAWRGGEPL